MPNATHALPNHAAFSDPVSQAIISQAIAPPPNTPQLPTLPDQLPSSPVPILPPIPPSSPTRDPAEPLKVKVQEIRVLGSTVFSDTQFAEVVAPFIGKELAFEELLTIRTAITDRYIREGYVTSGAFLPPQDVSSGIITLQVIEGRLEEIDVQGLTRLNSGYVKERLEIAGGTPLNLQRLESALQLLQLNPLFRSVQAELRSGTAPGQSILAVTLQESAPLSIATFVENRNSPNVGSLGPSLEASYRNVSGLGDQLYAQVGTTEGSLNYEFSYSVPINARDGTLVFRYLNNKTRIVEPAFDALDIRSNNETFSLGIRQPLIRTITDEFSLGLSLDLRQSQTFLFGSTPFSFSVGAEKGRSQVTVLRFSQDWINRSPSQVLAARSQFNIGLNALGATVNNTGVDGLFLSWIGQFQWVQAIGNNTTSVVRIASQLTGDALLPLEQFSVGGIDTVRGYRPNQQVGDSGIVGSVEVRFPITTAPDGIGTIQLVPFIDIGTTWNHRDAGIAPTLLASTGLGLRWQLDPYFFARVDFGIPLHSANHSNSSFSGSNIFFSLRLQLPPI
ncbi:MAG: ShlB/FhaC/HecB family hemolysin secretion/activation protein [Leptolyngbyaceae cyanobacterium bins.59]|nr:ShlB/FhaC/HecB family hemolysin secretion/activation protein [Leptolyngbyaceae cyanobacterium bins.59]